MASLWTGTNTITGKLLGGTLGNTGSSYSTQPQQPRQAQQGLPGSPYNFVAPQNSSFTGGGGGGGSGGGGDDRATQLRKMAESGGLNPSQMTEYTNMLQQQPQQPQIDFDALIAPALQGLDAAIAPLTQSTENRIGELQQGATTATSRTQADIAGQQQTLGRSKQDVYQRGESAADEARRQYSEISQGLQSRYGSTTGTGKFSNEILGGQTLRNIANVRQQVSSALVQIDDKIQQVQEIGRIAIQDIEDKTRSQVQQARDNLELQLADIRRQKGELQSRKAELASNAMQIYQNTVNQVNAQNSQFLQGLYMQQQSATQQLEMAKQKASSITSSNPDWKNVSFALPGENAGQGLAAFDPASGSYQYAQGAAPQAVSTNTSGDPELDKLLGL